MSNNIKEGQYYKNIAHHVGKIQDWNKAYSVVE